MKPSVKTLPNAPEKNSLNAAKGLDIVMSAPKFGIVRKPST